jgi:hypothetical protein
MSAIVPTVVDEPMDFTVIATSPKDMEAGQRSLILWAARKIQAIKQEIAEAAQQLALHKEKKWNTEGWRNEITKKERRAEFYRKIKMALEAGYYIVPPFPLDLFAIRVKRRAPKAMESTSSNNHDQPAEVLSAGQGRYVSPVPLRESYADTEKDYQGKERAVTRYYATEFQNADFPFKLARAEIKETVDKAMDLKLFDQLGVLPRTKLPDPIVCGQIIVPNKPCYGHGYQREAITFFIAWWLDTRTL